jgi:hypothetical protein
MNRDTKRVAMYFLDLLLDLKLMSDDVSFDWSMEAGLDIYYTYGPNRWPRR